MSDLCRQCGDLPGVRAGLCEQCSPGDTFVRLLGESDDSLRRRILGAPIASLTPCGVCGGPLASTDTERHHHPGACIAQLLEERDDARVERNAIRASLARAETERDEAVRRFGAVSLDCSELKAERDAARAEVEQLTAVLAQAGDDLAVAEAKVERWLDGPGEEAPRQPAAPLTAKQEAYYLTEVNPQDLQREVPVYRLFATTAALRSGARAWKAAAKRAYAGLTNYPWPSLYRVAYADSLALGTRLAAAEAEVERLTGVRDAFDAALWEAQQSRDVLATTGRALVSALPGCDRCERPATLAYGNDLDEDCDHYCASHAPDGCHDLAVAEPLRALVELLEEHEASGQTCAEAMATSKEKTDG